MGVAIARTSVVVLAGDTAANQVLGAFPGGLWVPSLRLTFNTSATGAITVSPVISSTDDAGDAAHLNGRAIIDRGEVQLNGQAGVIIDVGADALVSMELPVGLLPGSGPYWILVRAVSSNGLATSRVVCSAIGVPFEGAVTNRRSGDGSAPLGGVISGPGGGSAAAGGGPRG